MVLLVQRSEGCWAAMIDTIRTVLDSVAYPLSLFVAALFVFAGLIKLGRQPDFRRELSDYHLIPRPLLVVLAGILPGLELGGGFLALVPSTHMLGIRLLLVLLGVFSVVVAISIFRGLTTIHCACFGRFSRRLSWAIPIRNGLLAAPLIAALGSREDELTLAGIVGTGLAWTLGWLLFERASTLSLMRQVHRG